MEIIKSVLLYVVKNLYYSSLLVLPLLVILGFFKKINTEYKYKISLVVLLLIPLLPFISIPKSFNSVVTETRIEKAYSGLLDRPLTAISNVEPIYIEESISVKNAETSGLVIDNNSAVGSFESRSLDLKLLGLQALCLIYLLAVFVLMVRLINSVLSLRKKIKYSVVESDTNITGILKEIITILNIKKKIHIVLIKNVTTPFSVGIFKHYIVLPLEHTYNNQELKQILLHEATHILRRDCLITLFQRVIEIILFFNPAIWLISSSLTKNRELICDAQVVKSYNDRDSYAKVLLDTAMRSVGGVPQFCNGTVGSKRELSKRIDLIVNQKTEYKKVFKRVLQLTLVLLCFSSTLLIGCSNSRTKVEKLNDDVTFIIDKIDNDEDPLFYWARDKRKQMIKEIEVVEKSLRAINNSSNNRNLAYLLMKKAELYYRSYYEADTANYLTGDEFIASQEESLKLVDEYGSAYDKGILYLAASKVPKYLSEMESARRKALAFFKEVGDNERVAEIYLGYFFQYNYTHIDAIMEDLNDLDKFTTWNKLYRTNTSIKSIEKQLLHLDQFSEDVPVIFLSGMTLNQFDDGEIVIDGDSMKWMTVPHNKIPVLNPKLLNPYSIISAITGFLAFPDYNDLLNEDMLIDPDLILKPDMGIKTAIPKIEPFEQLTTPGKNFSNGYKVTYYVSESNVNQYGAFDLPYNGIHEVWYVKGIGIVQYKNSQEDVVIYLSDYRADEKSPSYFPVKKGNMWEYGITGRNIEDTKIIYEIEHVKNETFYMSMFGFSNVKK
ncbi:MAG: M56 family metallopeptidase [Spirochaetaceae bacterium]